MEVTGCSSTGAAPIILHILTTYFTGLYSAIVMYDDSAATNASSFLDAIVNTMATRNSPPADPLLLHWIRVSADWSDANLADLLLRNVELGVQGYIIVMSDMDRFMRLKYDVQQVSLQRIRDLIFLFLADHSLDIKSLFANPAFDLYPNHLVIQPTTAGPSESTSFQLWTQQFVGAENRTTEQLVLDVSSTGNWSSDTLIVYEDKMRDLRGRPVSVAAITYIPYTISYFVEPGNGTADAVNSTEPKTVFYDGTEARIMQEFCRIRNCSLKVMVFSGDDWGGVFNDTGIGQIGAVFDHEVDFAIGCIYKWFADYFEISQTIAKSGVTLLAPGAKPVSYALTPILPFTPTTWLFLFVSLNICIFLYYSIKFYSELLCRQRTFGFYVKLADVDRSKFKTSFRNTYLEVVAIFLQQASELRTSRLAARLVCCVLLVSGITLENAYSGALKALLTYPRYEQRIETVRQFHATGFHWGAPHFVWALSLQHAQVPHLKAIFNRFEIHDDAALHNRSVSGRFGVAVERLHAGSYSFGDYVQIDSLKKQDVLREDLYYDYTVGYSVRGWPMMPYFDRTVMSIMEFGFFNHWETEIVNQYLNLDTENYLRQLATGYTENTGPVVLRVNHIYGPLAMLAVGQIAALVGFIGELVYHHTMKRRDMRRQKKERKCLL